MEDLVTGYQIDPVYRLGLCSHEPNNPDDSNRVLVEEIFQRV